MIASSLIHTSNEDAVKIKKHYLAVHPGTFPTKESFKMGQITNWFKKKGLSTRYTALEILQMSAAAKCYVPAHIELMNETFTLISSSLIFVDVDDDEKITDPHKVLFQLKDICFGLFFTSSHDETKNRYRLAFALDKPVRDAKTYQYIFEAVSDVLKGFNIPVDSNAQSPLQRIRTANKGYIVGNLQATVKTEPFIEKMRKNKEEKAKQVAKRLQLFGERKERIYTCAELKARAEVIGYVHDYLEWQNLAYSLKSYVNEGHITDIEGYEVFSILCAGNDETVYWENLKPNRITVGTFIKASNDAGFKGGKYYHAASVLQVSRNVENVSFKKYLPQSFARDLLTTEQRILVKSPTGSGKTYSFINASKELSQELAKENFNRFYLFTTPTITLTEQIAESYEVMAVKGQTKDLYNKVKRYIQSGNRVFSCTYDMALALSEIIESIQKHCTFAVIVDEVHHLTSDYGYRKIAIDNLVTLEQKNNVRSYIALTGTPDAVLREPFDREIHVKTQYDKPPCRMWGALRYEKQTEGEALLYQVMKQKAESNKKLLVFVQNKEMIKRLHKKLLNNGIAAKAITSDGKANNIAYKALVKESKFPENTQIVLATSVISDGLNINNDSDSAYECIVYTAKDSMLFDTDVIRQCANRFRNVYHAFYVFLQTTKKDVNYLYNIEAAYAHDITLANNIVQLINNEFSDAGSYKLFKTARLEERFGIKFEDDHEVTFNKMLIRHNTNQEKNKFYMLYRDRLLQALNKVMGFQPKAEINIREELDKLQIDTLEIESELHTLKEMTKLEKKAKAENIAQSFKNNVYKAFKEQYDTLSEEESKTLLKTFKSAVTAEHYSCLKQLVHIADYQTCLKVVKTVNNRAKTHEYKRYIEALTNIIYFGKINRNTASKQVYNDLKKYIGKPMQKDELTVLARKINAKYRRSKLEDVMYMIENYFLHDAKRSNGNYFVVLEELTISKIANLFDLKEQSVVNHLKNAASQSTGVVARMIQNWAV